MDTLRYYERLIKSGANEAQAKAHVYALSDTFNDLVTKDHLHKELEQMRADVHTEINSVRIEIKHIRTIGWALFVAFAVPAIKTIFWS
jgi:hypothetical protein